MLHDLYYKIVRMGHFRLQPDAVNLETGSSAPFLGHWTHLNPHQKNSLSSINALWVSEKQIFVKTPRLEGAHLCREMNASTVSEYFVSYWTFRHFHILHVWNNFVCFGGISLMRTLWCEEDEFINVHFWTFLSYPREEYLVVIKLFRVNTEIEPLDGPSGTYVGTWSNRISARVLFEKGVATCFLFH